MRATANLTLLADAISSAKGFVSAFALVYTLIIFAYIISTWLRMPYSPWLNRIQRFLYDVTEPYLRLFRRILRCYTARAWSARSNGRRARCANTDWRY